MEIHRLSTEDALASLRSSRRGLSSSEAQRRLREYGPNRVQRLGREPSVLRLVREFIQFFSIILWVAAGLAFLAEWLDPGQGMARIGVALVVVILVSGIFSFWQEYRVERTLAALQKLLPQQAKVLRDGSVHPMAIEEIAPGDIVMLEAGDNIPADCRLIEGFGVRVNTATITGEALSKALNADPSDDVDLIHSGNVLLAGTSVVSGQATAVVFATGGLTEFGKIAHLSQATSSVVSPLRNQLAHLSRLIAVLAIVIGVTFFAIGAAIDVPFWQDFIFSIGIIVAMVPEGLLPTLTLALVLAAQRMAKRNVLIRHLTSVETLGSTTVICTDKTGTLTENRMQIRELVLGNERYSAAAVDGWSRLADAHRDFFLAANLCHDVKIAQSAGKAGLLGDPMEIALVEMGRKAMPGLPGFPRLDEISFDSDRMRQSVVHQMPEGPVLFCKGALESVLPLCSLISSGRSAQPLDMAARQRLLRVQEAMAESGLRVLASASRRLPAAWRHDLLEEHLVFQGLIGFEDPPRPEVPEAARRCREAGIKVVIVTGDHPHTAAAVARRTGIITSANPTIITGDQLRKTSAIGLQLALDAPEVVFARVAADQKMRIVQALINKRHIVAVTGDGVNDAPALKAAHIGIAMGVTGTDVAKEAADVVLLDDNFASIVSAVEEGRAVFQNIRKFLTYVLVHNVAELVPYLAFVLFKIPLALTPIQILAIDMGTDSLTALGLGVERPDQQIMHLQPRSQRERLLSWPVALRAYLFLGVIEAAAAMTAFFFTLWGSGWSYGRLLPEDDPLYLRATTACLTAIVFMQIVNVFLCRSSVRSVLSMRLLDNPLILSGVALEIALILVIDYTSIGNFVLDTAPVPTMLWLILIPMAIGMIALEELRKWIARKMLAGRGLEFRARPAPIQQPRLNPEEARRQLANPASENPSAS
jgi:calcium-translocating P-type ATPase